MHDYFFRGYDAHSHIFSTSSAVSPSRHTTSSSGLASSYAYTGGDGRELYRLYIDKVYLRE